MYATLVFNGKQRELKMFLSGSEALGKPSGLIHTIPCHDVGIADGEPGDVYGHRHACPPGSGYRVGYPQVCATRNADSTIKINHDDDRAYGCYFLALSDDPMDDFAKHNRDGIGIHGGGSDLLDPFAFQQGWEYTFGCLRCQNSDLENVLVPFVKWVQNNKGTVSLNVIWA